MATTSAGYCGQCGAYITEEDGNFYITIARDGSATFSARCMNQMICQENRDLPDEHPFKR